MFSNELTCQILEYINKNINKEITAEELSNLFYFDKTYIMKRFKKETKLSIHEYINTIRVYNSLILFRNENYILSIAFKNGFNSLEYFSETFKKIIGVSPTTYRKYIKHESISNKKKVMLLEGINKIISINTFIDDYLKRRKPKEMPVKKLSLFK